MNNRLFNECLVYEQSAFACVCSFVILCYKILSSQCFLLKICQNMPINNMEHRSNLAFLKAAGNEFQDNFY